MLWDLPLNYIAYRLPSFTILSRLLCLYFFFFNFCRG